MKQGSNFIFCRTIKASSQRDCYTEANVGKTNCRNNIIYKGGINGAVTPCPEVTAVIKKIMFV
jgi:hypothetical protein